MHQICILYMYMSNMYSKITKEIFEILIQGIWQDVVVRIHIIL